MIQVSKLAEKIFDALIQEGAQVYLVGGCVRDALLNRDYHDIDVEVYHLSFDQLTEILSRFGHVFTYGHFAISSIDTLPDYDFALPRKETKLGDKHTDFEVDINPDLTLADATSRRDLTINALMYDVSTHKVIDIHHGLEDLKNKTLRCVSTDTFIEDPLRVLRVAAFKSRLNFKVETNTCQLCASMVQKGMLDYLSIERKEEEYNQILLSDDPASGIQFLHEIGALEDYLEVLSHTKQRPDYHPEGDVLTHTLMVLSLGASVKDQTQVPLGFMWACLLHDIGKPIVSNGYHAKGHEMAGAKLFDEVVSFPQGKKRRTYIRNLIAYHMALMQLRDTDHPKYHYYMLLNRLKDTRVEDLLLITQCDKQGRGYFNSEDWDDFYQFITELMHICGTVPLQPLITGKDLLSLNINHKDYTAILDDCYKKQCQGYNKQEIYRKLEEKYGK